MFSPDCKYVVSATSSIFLLSQSVVAAWQWNATIWSIRLFRDWNLKSKYSKNSVQTQLQKACWSRSCVQGDWFGACCRFLRFRTKWASKTLSLHGSLTPFCSQPNSSIVCLCHGELFSSQCLSLLITWNHSTDLPLLNRKTLSIQPAVLIDFWGQGQMVFHFLLHFSHPLNGKLYVSSPVLLVIISRCCCVWRHFVNHTLQNTNIYFIYIF